MRKGLLYILFFLSLTQLIHSQKGDGVASFDIPVKNSLKFNKFIINPAFSYAREDESFITVVNRRQWTEFENAPQTYFFSYSGRFRDDNSLAVGLFQQNYGILTTFGVVGNFARNVSISNDSNLTFGFNLGYINSGLNDGKIITNDLSDASLQNIPKNSSITINPGINYGVGFMDFGLALNNILFYNINNSGMVADDPAKGVEAHMMYTGYIYRDGFLENSKFSTLLKGEIRKDKTVFTGSILFNVPKGLWAQASYNSVYGASGGVGLTIAKKISLGYTIEKGMGNFSGFGMTHEITLAYKLKGYGDFEDYKPIVKATKKTNPNIKRAVVKKKSPAELKKERDAQLAIKAKNDSLNKANVAAAAAQRIQDAKDKAEADRLRIEAEKARLAKEAAEAKAKAEAEARAKAEADRLLALQGKDKATLEAERLRKEKLAAEAKAKAEEAARIKAEAEAARLRKEKAAADAKAKLDAEARAKAEADRLKAAQSDAEKARLAKEAADAKAKADAEANAKLEAERLRLAKEAADAKAKADAEAKAKLEADKLKAAQTEAERLRLAKEAADAKAKADAEAKAKLDAEKANAEAEKARLAKEAADAKAKADAEAKAKLEADKLKAAQTEAERLRLAKEAADAKAKADAEAKAKLDAEKANAEAEKARLAKEAADAKAKLDAEKARLAKEAADAKAKADAEAKAKLDAERANAEAEKARLAKEAADAKAKADAEAKAKLDAEKANAEAEKARLAKEAADAKAKADAEANAKLEAERLRKEKEASDAKAKADQEAERLRLEAEAKAKLNAAKTAEDKQLDYLSQVIDDSKKNQSQSLSRLDSIANAKESELKELKRVNDLSEQGVVTEAKEFQSSSAANRALESLKSEIAENNRNQNNFIKEFETLYNDRLKKVPNKNDVINQNYLKTIEKLKLDKSISDKRNTDLLAKLERIKTETDIEKKRRIKRADFESNQTKYLKDRETLKQIKKSTSPTSKQFTANDFDFGDDNQSNMQIVKNIENVESGFYLVLAVHKDEAKRDAFLIKAIEAGQTNIEFFYNVNTGNYYIYYQKFSEIQDATSALEQKGNKPYNGKMVIVKVEK